MIAQTVKPQTQNYKTEQETLNKTLKTMTNYTTHEHKAVQSKQLCLSCITTRTDEQFKGFLCILFSNLNAITHFT